MNSTLLRCFLLLLPGWLSSAVVLAADGSGTATLVSMQGKAEFRAAGATDWRPLTARQQLAPGQTVRTGRHGRLALLLTDRTQIRLNENTTLEIQAIEPAPRTAGQTRFRQLAGRAWVQSKTPPRALQWHTPTATAGIRGTDWEMAVAEDGRSLLSVFSGEVAFFNDQGGVQVAANEQAQAEAGKAPVKLAVKNLRERVQWVTAYQINPWQHVALDGDSLPGLRQRLQENPPPVARGRLLADLGRWTEAEQAFTERRGEAEAKLGLAWVALRRHDLKATAAWLGGAAALKGGEAWAYADIARLIESQELDAAQVALTAVSQRGDLSQPAPWLLLSELHAYEGRSEAALDAIRAGLVRFPDHPRLYAQAARLLLLDDRAPAAASTAEQAIGADLASFEGWLALADIARREGDAGTARTAYDLAIALKPDDDRPWFGRGAVLNEREYVAEARADLARALELDPEGQGYRGEQGTLESFANEFATAAAAYRAALDANPADFVALTGLGVLELKLGHTNAALEALLKAGVMEPRYARAHLYTAAAYYRLGDVKQAESELARAYELDDKDPLPYFVQAMIGSDRLRPVDAIEAARNAIRRLPYLKSLNQLANDQQGSANLGQSFAFLGLEDWARAYAQDSYTPFWAGSHLFLADRYNGLYTKNSELFQGLIAEPTVFGAGNRFKSLLPGPASNFDLGLRYTQSDNVDGFSPQVQWSGYRAEPAPYAWYLGYENVNWDLLDRPYDLDVFTAAFGIKPRHDLGFFAFADAANQDSRPVGRISGIDYDVSDGLDTRRLDLGLHYRLNPVSQFWLKAGHFDSTEKAAGQLGQTDIRAATDVKLPEFGFRHSFETERGHQLSWGLDYGRRATDGFLDDTAFLLRDDYRLRERSLDLYLSDIWRATPSLTLQADMFWQQDKGKAVDQPSITLFDPPVAVTPVAASRSADQFSPRLGLVWQPDDRVHVRIAWQNWLRPAGFSSLAPVATAGIPLDDRLVRRGGELNRGHVQGEWELDSRTFLHGFLDYKDIDNRRFDIRPFSVGELESLNKLRPRDYGQLLRDDLYEFVDAPDYAGGLIKSLGMGINRVLGREWGVMGRYLYTVSENRTDANLAVPWLPRHTLALGATWINPRGWYVAGLLAWRSERFQDEANNVGLDAGVSGDLDIFWESSDKHWLVRFSGNDLLDNNSQLTTELNYRF